MGKTGFMGVSGGEFSGIKRVPENSKPKREPSPPAPSRKEQHRAKMFTKKMRRATQEVASRMAPGQLEFEVDHKLQARIRAKLREIREREAAGEKVDRQKEAEEFEA